MSLTLTPIAHIRTDFGTKFGVPRQSGVVQELTARIVFEPPYRNPDALRGLSDFSHLWLVWHFSEVKQEGWSPTVRPPRLGGNTRMGVFATRSPYRPNPIGLSCVRLESVEYDTPDGPVLHVCGADLMDGTPIYDVKPYLPYVDSHPEAAGGFAHEVKDYAVTVDFPGELLEKIPEEKRAALIEILSQDPRPGYKRGDERPFGMSYAGFNVRFSVKDGALTVVEVTKE